MARQMAKSEEGQAQREGMLADKPEVLKEVEAIFGSTSEAEPPPPPKEETPPEPDSPAPETPAAGVPDPTDYKAELAAVLAEREKERLDWQKQREGMVSALSGRRRERREAAQQSPLSQAQQTTAQSQGIALKWNEKGEAFIDAASMAQFRVPEEEIERRIESRVREHLEPIERERLRSAVVSEDPGRLTPILGELDFAYRHLDSMVQFKQHEMGSDPFKSIEEAVSFIEYSGVADKFRAQYPHIAPDANSVREFMLSALRPNAESLRSFVKMVADRKNPAAPRQEARPQGFEPPPSVLDPNKPRPHAERGGKAPAHEGNSMERELADLIEKANKQGAWSISETERERMGWLTKTLSKRKAS